MKLSELEALERAEVGWVVRYAVKVEAGVGRTPGSIPYAWEGHDLPEDAADRPATERAAEELKARFLAATSEDDYREVYVLGPGGEVGLKSRRGLPQAVAGGRAGR